MCICAVSFDLVLIPDAISLFNVFCSQASAETSTVVAYRIYVYFIETDKRQPLQLVAVVPIQ